MMFDLQSIIEYIGKIFYDKPDVIAAIAAVIALSFTGISWNRDRQTRELQTIDEIRKELMDLERELIDKYASKSPEDKKKWDSLFFNTLEWFAFLINEKKLKEKKLISFFSPAIINWYDTIFCVYAGPSVDDSTQYAELKKLYKKLSLKNPEPLNKSKFQKCLSRLRKKKQDS